VLDDWALPLIVRKTSREAVPDREAAGCRRRLSIRKFTTGSCGGKGYSTSINSILRTVMERAR
jgi:hypothetical protein